MTETTLQTIRRAATTLARHLPVQGGRQQYQDGVEQPILLKMDGWPFVLDTTEDLQALHDLLNAAHQLNQESTP